MLDTVIVGAGPSGILVWERLTAAGLNAVLLEAGPSKSVTDPTPDSAALWTYRTSRGALLEWPRAYGIGGRTAAWGGNCFRFPQAVFERGGWPYSARTLAADYAAAECWLGVQEGRPHPYHRRAIRRLGWPLLPLRSACFEGTPWSALNACGARAARPNHVAVALEHEHDRALAIQVAAVGAPTSRISARTFVLAAGPIESARLLLASGVGELVSSLGRGMVRHPAVGYMLVEPHPLPSMLSSYDFVEGALVPFSELGFSIELLGPQTASELDRAVMRNAGLSLAEAPRLSVTFIRGFCETAPNKKSGVTLSRTQRDSLGRQIPIVHLATTASDLQRIAQMKATCIELAETLARSGAELILVRDPPPNRYLFHEAGTCIMGSSADRPCDPRGRLRALGNVWIADASVFPSAGDRHPTLTVLAHALRVARDVQRHLTRMVDTPMSKRIGNRTP